MIKFKLNMKNLNKLKSVSNNLEKIEDVRSPEELLQFLNQKIKYGFVKKSNGQILEDQNSKEWRDVWLKEYYLQRPEELLKNKYGVCWDFVELERDWFSKKGYEYRTFYMAVIKKGGSNLPTHTFLVYKDKNNNKWYWFEYSWSAYRGIHEYGDIGVLLGNVSEKNLNSIKKIGAKQEDIDNHKIYEYKGSVFGSNPIEFARNIIVNNRPLDIKNL